MKHSIHLAAIALLTTLLVTSCDTFSAPADPDKNTEQVKDISGTWQLTTVSRNSNDITETMDFSQFQINLKKDGKYTIENYLPFVVRHNARGKLTISIILSPLFHRGWSHGAGQYRYPIPHYQWRT